MPMSLSSLTADFKASVHDAAKVFEEKAGDPAASDVEFEKILHIAAQDLARFRPVIKKAVLSLQAGVEDYAAPADIRGLLSNRWQKAKTVYWQQNNSSPMPKAELVKSGELKFIEFYPAPTAAQLADLGAEYKYTYLAHHHIDAIAANTTVDEGDRGLLLLRAQAEFAKQLSMRGIYKPVRLRDGMTQGPRNATPAALYGQLMREFEMQGQRYVG